MSNVEAIAARGYKDLDWWYRDRDKDRGGRAGVTPRRPVIDAAAMQERNAAMIKDRQGGLAIAEIAVKYGVTTGSVSMLRKRAGIPAQHRKPKKEAV